jgi:ABC-2 type transport system permease protein
MNIVNGTVMWLTFRQLFARKRLVAAILLALAPAIIGLLYSSRNSNTGIQPDEFLIQIYRAFVLGVLLPLAAVIFGTGAFGIDLDEGTLVYLLVKPLRRWSVVLSRYLVAVLATAAVMLPAILLPWLVVGVHALPFSTVLAVCAGATVGSVLYSALFIPLGIASKRALVVGLLYVVVLEEVVSRTMPGARSLSIREYAFAVTKALARGSDVFQLPAVSLSTVWVMGTVVLVGGLAFAMRKLSRFEAEERL